MFFEIDFIDGAARWSADKATEAKVDLILDYAVSLLGEPDSLV
jgi:hypothetical protein